MIKKIELNLETSANQLLVLLFSADFVFFILHIFNSVAGYTLGPGFDIEVDWSFSEVFQYLKEFWIVLLLLLLAVRVSVFPYIAWSLLFVYFLLDDSVRIHETLGTVISDYLHFVPMIGLRAKDFGELFVSAFFGFIFVPLFGVAYYVSGKSGRTVSNYLAAMVAALIFFGVFVDMLHGMAGSPVWQLILGMAEDGGEMLVMSLILWFVFHLNEGLVRQP
ncbi:MAG: hypothetical protein Q8O19_01825 [Rectinemataceae bacterium]|nr:hypothetical protein [Rectinemataceae bacterium]